MKWATWDEAAIASVCSGAVTLTSTRLPANRITAFIREATKEFAFVAGVYSIWRVARVLPLKHNAGAIERGRQINDWQQALHLPSEISIQHFVIDHDWLARFVNYYYAAIHVPSIIIFLIWLFVLHRDHYLRWRTGLVILTAFCLVIRFIRVAPPRFIPELEFVSLAKRYGLDVYGPVGTGVSDQFAAMPSIHVGWAAVVGLGMYAASKHWPVRIVGVAHLLFTIFVVAATGHHWWADGFVALALLGVGIAMNDVGRAWGERRRLASATPLLATTTDNHGDDGDEVDAADPPPQFEPV
ncbi:MAG: phosphatase PAP2 family protein [Acidimicrobiales bacterium]